MAVVVELRSHPLQRVVLHSVIYRYKNRSNTTERQQTKWVLAGFLASASLIIPFTIISLYFPPAQPSMERVAFIFLVHYPIYFISYLTIPGGIAVAISGTGCGTLTGSSAGPWFTRF